MTPAAAHLDFVIIGAMKAGTTSLFDFLAAHPGVCAPRNKEPHYFTRGYNWPAAYYRRLFRHRTEGQICGEASPTYAWVQAFPEAPERIARDAPDTRLIYTIRDPLERVLSHLRHQDLLGGPAASVADAAEHPPLWERSSYRTAIEAYLEHFPREQLLVVDLADLHADPRWLGRVLDHLGLPAAPIEPLALPASNVSEERIAVPGFVSRVATTPIGAMVRDLVPKATLQRMKQVVARRDAPEPGTAAPASTSADATPAAASTSADAAGAAMPAAPARITVDDLRREKPDECAEIEAQYRWARAEFIDAVEL